jgi:hypothetical protein
MILLLILTFVLYYLLIGFVISTLGLITVLTLDLKGFTYKDFISFTFFWLYAVITTLNKGGY